MEYWKRPSKTAFVASAALFLHLSEPSVCFQPKLHSRSCKNRPLAFSSVGGRDGPPPPSGDDDGKGEWGDFLDPNKQESENLQRAREYMSENSLPISFDNSQDDTKEDTEKDNAKSTNSIDQETTNESAILLSGGLTKEILENNPYMAVVSRLSPSELISKFTATAHPRVQNAVRTTILGLVGGLPKQAFDTTTITTGQRLASLMFQLQMTGYMFKNAEYRLSLQQSLGDFSSSKFLLAGSEDEEDSDSEKRLKGKVRGKLRIRYRGQSTGENGHDDDESSAAREMEVDAASYMSELRSEVSQLRDELMITRKEKEDQIRKDLLLYIRTLPEKELRSLTNTMSEDVLVAMKGLVNAVMSGIGDGIGPETITEQSGEAMAQLCMWQLAVGYNLRTLEVREEIKKSLIGGSSNSDNLDAGAGIISEFDADAFE